MPSSDQAGKCWDRLSKYIKLHFVRPQKSMKPLPDIIRLIQQRQIIIYFLNLAGWLTASFKRIFLLLLKILYFDNHLINMETNKLDLPKVYSSLQLAMSIISCFCKQTNWPYLKLKPNQRRSFFKYFFFFSKPSDPNKVKIWHRLPQQMPIRCYLIKGQSRTNKSNRK